MLKQLMFFLWLECVHRLHHSDALAGHSSGGSDARLRLWRHFYSGGDQAGRAADEPSSLPDRGRTHHTHGETWHW